MDKPQVLCGFGAFVFHSNLVACLLALIFCKDFIAFTVMDWLSFFSKIVEALAWPTALVASLLIMRKQLLNAIPFLRKVKYGELEAEFQQEIALVKAESSQFETQNKSTLIPDSIVQTATVSPLIAVRESWKYLENTIIDVAQSFPDIPDQVKRLPPLLLVRELENRNKIQPRAAEVYRRMATILAERNILTSVVDITPTTAMEIIKLNVDIAGILSEVKE